jgi:hypothetical protein
MFDIVWTTPEDDQQIETCGGERNNKINIVILLIVLTFIQLVYILISILWVHINTMQRIKTWKLLSAHN